LEARVTSDETKKGNTYERKLVIAGIIYTVLQISIFFLPIEPYVDYYNHINWGIGYENGDYPYRDYSANEYPVLSTYGWIASYKITSPKTYILLSITMNFPYWILAIFGTIALYRILVDEGIEENTAYKLGLVFLFLPFNLIDTLNNHGNLGTSATIILAIYFWKQKKLVFSALFVSAGFSIKLYPIFVAPFLVWSLKEWRLRIKYSIYIILFIVLFHIPVLLILPEYYKVLFWRTTEPGGITYSLIIFEIGKLINFSQLSTLIWLGSILVATLALLEEWEVSFLEKFSIILMINNLLEPRGGIGHIATILPFMAIYFFAQTNNNNEKKGFVAYLIIGTVWAFDRIMFNFRESENEIFRGVITLIMIILSTILLIVYIKGLHRMKKLELKYPKMFFSRFRQRSIDK
jgi:hypothetical protein